MELSNIILTGWGTETLSPEDLQKLGFNDATEPLEMVFAKAIFNQACWAALLGPCTEIGRPELAAALRAIQLGQYVRQSLNLAVNQPIASASQAAVFTARRTDPTVGWLPPEQLSVLDTIGLLQGTPVIVPARTLAPVVPPSGAPLAEPLNDAQQALQLRASELLLLLRRNDPLAVFVSLLACNDSDLINLLEQARAHQVPAGVLPLGEEGFQEWLLARRLAKDSRRVAAEQPDVALKELSLDDLAWRQAYPALAAARGRLEQMEQQVAAGTAASTLAMGLIRRLCLEELACLGVLPRPHEGPAYPAGSPLLAAVRQIVKTMGLGALPVGFLTGDKRRACRAVWRSICEWLAHDEIAALVRFTRQHGKSVNGKQQLAAQMLGFQNPRFKNVPLFPLTDAERTAIAAYLQQEEAQRQAAAAEKRRQKALAEEQAREAFRQQEAQKLAALAALTPGRRAIAILKDEAYWRGRWQDLAPEWQQAAETLQAKRQATATARAAARQEARLKKLMAQPVPSSRYLVVQETPQGVQVRFDPGQDLTLGSASLRTDLLLIARSRLGKGQLKHPDGHKDIFQTEWDGPHLDALVARTEMDKLERALADIDAELQAALVKPLAPYHVEQALNITKAERLRWTKAGRLAVVGKDSFRKGRTWIEYPLYGRTAIRNLSAETIARWRAEDATTTARKRKAGAVRAVETRKRNIRLREEEQIRIDQMARDAARTLGDLTAVPLVKLAIYTQLASRWAKRFQALGRSTDSQHFYDLKDQALRVIAASPHAKIAYVPSDQAKYHVELCEDHYDEWREFRRYDRYVRFWDWVEMESDWLKTCKDCTFQADYTYWALYLIELSAGDLRLSFHVPHSIGIHYLPPPRHLEKRPDESSEGMFRYGRPVDEEEMLLHPAPKVEAAIEGLLRLFKPAETGAQPQAHRLPG